MRNVTVESKEHYKSYKAGKHWVFACLAVVSMGLGLVDVNETAQADTDASADTQVSDTVTNTESKTVTLAQSSTTQTVNGQLKTPTDTDKSAAESRDDTTSKPTSSTSASEHQAEMPEENTAGTDTPEKVTTTPTSTISTETTPKVQQQTSSPTTSTTPTSSDALHTAQPVTDSLPTPATAVTPRSALVKAATDTTTSIDGVDASVWLPDTNLRTWVEDFGNYRNFGQNVTINDSNLSQYVANYTDLLDNYNNGINVGTVQSFAGLQYFTNLNTFTYYQYIPASEMIDFSFAPNLTSLSLANNSGVTTTPTDLSDFLNTWFGQNLALSTVAITGYGLTGQIPDLTTYTSLQRLNLSFNNLSGDLSQMGALPKLVSLQLYDNQLTGDLPSLTTLPSLTYLAVYDNDLTGSLPDMSGFTGIYDLRNNHFTSGMQTLSLFGSQGTQTVTGKTYTLTPTNQTFDPITDVISGAQGTDGKIDPTDAMVAYNLGNGVAYFTVAPDPDNPLGFKLVAQGDVPDGEYTIEVWNEKTNQYKVDLTFTVKNGEDPVTPVNPGNPGTGTGTTDPGTMPATPTDPTAPSASDNGETTSQGTGSVSKNANAGTLSKNGSAANITSAKKKRMVNRSVTPRVTTPSQASKRLSAQAVAASRGIRAIKTTSAVMQHAATLPQTGERQSGSWVAAGIAVAIATLGLGLTSRRQR